MYRPLGAGIAPSQEAHSRLEAVRRLNILIWQQAFGGGRGSLPAAATDGAGRPPNRPPTPVGEATVCRKNDLLFCVAVRRASPRNDAPFHHWCTMGIIGNIWGFSQGPPPRLSRSLTICACHAGYATRGARDTALRYLAWKSADGLCQCMIAKVLIPGARAAAVHERI